MTSILRRSDARGFTLAELMVALVVISIVMAISFPMLAKVNRTQRLAGAAARVEAALMRARSTAVTKRTPVRVSFIAANSTLQLEQDTDNDGDFDVLMRTVEIDDDIGFANISFDDGTTVTFDQRGAPDNPGMVVLSNGGESVQRILIASGSGAVSVSSIASSAEEQQSEGY